ncbi:preprotein translocase subunit SecG [Helcococcus kunzii]|uniref:Preprotein translocase, SecG subunit n=1 Tax=Helcococcus kunzii ATCC 51366 TaxID=883114 RepID=H3NNA7_9FIRM|nr:preprotein translocase subunit SecG [Helcococcus kunzii]EHR33882.1 preprotein translocase, SecG subunit [Helcococcus kunzii ATCC 51366]
MKTVFLALLVLSSLGIIIRTFLIEHKAEGKGSLSGQDSNIFGVGATKTKEALLNKIVVVPGVLFLIS